MRLSVEQPKVKMFVWITYFLTLSWLGILAFLSAHAPRFELRGTGFLVCDILIYTSPLFCLAAGYLTLSRRISVYNSLFIVCCLLLSALMITLAWGPAWTH